jgi:hypothetical protein
LQSDASKKQQVPKELGRLAIDPEHDYSDRIEAPSFLAFYGNGQMLIPAYVFLGFSGEARHTMRKRRAAIPAHAISPRESSLFF